MKAYLQSFRVLTEEEIDAAVQLSRRRVIPRHGFFIREGQVCEEVAFVQSGFFRSFYHHANGDEITYCFTFSGSYLTAYSSFLTGNPAAESICALADAEIYSISRTEVRQLEQSSANWLAFSKLLAEQEYLSMERRVFSLLKEPAEARYQDLLRSHPEYLQLIPLGQLASYLGITQRHLSRLRKLHTI
ncbi:MAG: Crp/Fnr family transcriptional regulator [Bacteroidia bacterium]|nr:Crp/Fnr family transcriptional regulator [Bacteroidia bacterium]